MDEPDRYTTANLPVHLLRCLAETSKELGIDPTRLCLAGFDVADLSNPSCRISLRQASTMIRRALEMRRGGRSASNSARARRSRRSAWSAMRC